MFLLSHMIDTIFILSENAQYVNKKFIKFANNWGNPYLDISCSILLNKRGGGWLSVDKLLWMDCRSYKKAETK